MKPAGTSAALFFTFPEDSPLERRAATVEFRVEAGEYRGVVRVPRVFQHLLSNARPERCDEGYPVRQDQRAEAAPGRQLTEDGNVETSGRDWR